MSEQNLGEATLRELAVRLLSPRYPGAEPLQVTDLPPGQLPPNSPIELSLPPDARLIGSVIRGQDSTFFASSHGPLLRLSGLPSPVARIEGHLALEMNPSRHGYGPLRRQLPAEIDLIPPLLALDGAQQQSLGGGGGGEWRANAELTTDLAFAAATEHYTRQLEAAGWRESSHGESDCVRWSVRDFADKDGEPWRAYLFVFQRPDEPTHDFLDIHCQWVGSDSSGGAAWFTYSSFGAGA